VQRKTSASTAASGPVSLSRRLAGFALGMIVGGALGMIAARKLHIHDSKWWVLTVAGGALVIGVWLFITPPPGLDWHTPIGTGRR